MPTNIAEIVRGTRLRVRDPVSVQQRHKVCTVEITVTRRRVLGAENEALRRKPAQASGTVARATRSPADTAVCDP